MKMVVFDFPWSFSRFYQLLRLNENENNYQENKMKMVKKYESENRNDLSVVCVFSITLSS